MIRSASLLAGLLLMPSWLAVRSKPIWPEPASRGIAVTQQNHQDSLSADQEQGKSFGCAMSVLKARTLVTAKKRRLACPDTFTVRASYAWWLSQHHAPRAIEAVIRAMPTSSAEMNAFYAFDGNTTAQLADKAYSGYYDALFHAGQVRPEILPKLFLIAAQFGTDNQNVDEEIWFCQKLQKIYQGMPTRYMRALSHVSNNFVRRYAMDCRKGPSI